MVGCSPLLLRSACALQVLCCGGGLYTARAQGDLRALPPREGGGANNRFHPNRCRSRLSRQIFWSAKKGAPTEGAPHATPLHPLLCVGPLALRQGVAAAAGIALALGEREVIETEEQMPVARPAAERTSSSRPLPLLCSGGSGAEMCIVNEHADLQRVGVGAGAPQARPQAH
jgi:hypothetical protein